MIISSTTYCDLAGTKYGPDAIDEHLKVFIGSPFKDFEFALTCITPARDSIWMREGDDWKRMVERVQKIQQEQGYRFVSAHSMSWDAYADEETVRLVRRAIDRSMEACQMLGAPQTVIHGMSLWRQREEPDVGEKSIQKNIEFYRSLADSSEKYGVDMLIENYGRDCWVTYPFTTGAGMYDFVKRAGIPRLHINWDTGHANIAAEQSQYEDILAMKEELHSLHIHDNWGNVDCHAIPYYGTVNFEEIIRGLKEIDYKGPFNLEASDMFVISSEEGRGRKRRNCAYGDKLADPPMEIMTEYYNLLYKTAYWMLGEYDLNEK